MTHSIVIPLFNKAAYVAQTLDSLRLQTKLPDELIIVDDVSTDGSLQLVQAYLEKHADAFANCRIEIIALQKNQGPGHARNIGFSSTTTELISFLDADDLFHPQLLTIANQHFETQALDFLVLNMMFLPGKEVYPNMKALKKYLIPIADDLYELRKPLKAVTSPHFIMGVGSNVICKRKWLTSTQYLSNAYLNEGIDFWYRVLKHIMEHTTGKIALLCGNYLLVNEVPESLSRKTYTHFKEIDLPPLLKRYKNSKNLNDQLLMGMIGKRWYSYAIQRLNSRKQKLLFIGYYSYLIPRYLAYQLLRLLP